MYEPEIRQTYTMHTSQGSAPLLHTLFSVKFINCIQIHVMKLLDEHFIKVEEDTLSRSYKCVLPMSLVSHSQRQFKENPTYYFILYDILYRVALIRKSICHM